MLIIETFIAPSQIHDLGVFAGQKITAGSQVWVFNPIIDYAITEAEIESLPHAARKVALAHAFVNNDGRMIFPETMRSFSTILTIYPPVKKRFFVTLSGCKELRQFSAEFIEIPMIL